MFEVAIVGGGISGLSAAYYLEKYAGQAGIPISIQLLEARDRLGGVILTERTEDFLLEGGPDSFLSVKPAAVELCRELGLSDHLVPSNDQRRKTFIWQGGKLREIPEGMMFVVPTKVWPVFASDLFSWGGKFRLAMAPFLPQTPDSGQDMAVADFIRRRLGREVLERLVEPLLAAVYGADVDSLSARAVLPQLLGLEEKYGSLWRGIRASRHVRPGNGQPGLPDSLFVTLRDGLGEIPAALEKKLGKTRITTGTEIAKVGCRRTGQGFSLHSSRGETAADAVVVATPAHAAANLLGPLDARLAGHLASIPYHSSLTLALGFEERVFPQGLDGFGFVVPRSERKKLVACTWVSTKFPFRSAPGRILLRGFLGGAREPAILEENDGRILETALRELGEIMGLRAAPTFARIYRWERCMPQYGVGHLRRLEEISSLLAHHPGLLLAGNGYRGVGIPDCIQSSATAAAATLDYLQSLGRE